MGCDRNPDLIYIRSRYLGRWLVGVVRGLPSGHVRTLTQVLGRARRGIQDHRWLCRDNALIGSFHARSRSLAMTAPIFLKTALHQWSSRKTPCCLLHVHFTSAKSGMWVDAVMAWTSWAKFQRPLKGMRSRWVILQPGPGRTVSRRGPEAGALFSGKHNLESETCRRSETCRQKEGWARVEIWLGPGHGHGAWRMASHSVMWWSSYTLSRQYTHSVVVLNLFGVLWATGGV